MSLIKSFLFHRGPSRPPRAIRSSPRPSTAAFLPAFASSRTPSTIFQTLRPILFYLCVACLLLERRPRKARVLCVLLSAVFQHLCIEEMLRQDRSGVGELAADPGE